MRRSRVAPLLAALSLLPLALAGAGCSHSPDRPVALDPHWRAVSLPAPPGPPGRVLLRDAVRCPGHDYVVGAVLSPGGDTRPAAWTSTDGRTWRSMALAAHQYYARRAILYSVACRGEEVVVLGAKAGGAHFNPRTTFWHLRRDGALTDVTAPFELFGGPRAVSVRRVVAGPAGWLIAGTRSSGAAVWTSADGRAFRLLEARPGLASGPGEQTSALDAVADDEGWTVVGRLQRRHDGPIAWNSADGLTWTRQPVPAGGAGFAGLEGVVRTAAPGRRTALVAIGLRDERFGVWERRDGRWRVASTFGRVDSRGHGAAYVAGLAATGRTVLAAVSDGTRFGLWAREDGWRQVRVPLRPTTSGEHQLTVSARDGSVLLLADDGHGGRLWRATLP